jgi:hypothetical protein
VTSSTSISRGRASSARHQQHLLLAAAQRAGALMPPLQQEREQFANARQPGSKAAVIA